MVRRILYLLTFSFFVFCAYVYFKHRVFTSIVVEQRLVVDAWPGLVYSYLIEPSKISQWRGKIFLESEGAIALQSGVKWTELVGIEDRTFRLPSRCLSNELNRSLLFSQSVSNAFDLTNRIELTFTNLHTELHLRQEIVYHHFLARAFSEVLVNVQRDWVTSNYIQLKKAVESEAEILIHRMEGKDLQQPVDG